MSERGRPLMSAGNRDIETAWKYALRYAGEGGHIATLPEIIEAREAAHKSFYGNHHGKMGRDEVPLMRAWNQAYTSASGEYVGTGADRRQKIIVAHGVGPLSTLDGITEAYDHDLQENPGGVISTEQFRSLENGDYGEVKVIDVDAFVPSAGQVYKDDVNIPEVTVLDKVDYENFVRKRCLAANGERLLDLHQAMRDPLTRMRLGSQACRYLCTQANLAEDVLRRAGRLIYGDPVHIIEPVFETRGHDLSEPMPRHLSYTEHMERIAALGRNAAAHILGIGDFQALYARRNEMLISPYFADPGSFSNFVAVPKEADIEAGIGKLPTAEEILSEDPERFMRSTDGEKVSVITPVRLGDIGGKTFTRYPKDSLKEPCVDSSNMEYLVKSCTPVGECKTFMVDEEFFLRYTLDQVRRIKPRGANAYRIVDIGNRHEHKPGHTLVTVQFFKADIDTSRRVPRAEEISTDFDKLMDAHGVRYQNNSDVDTIQRGV